MRTRAGLIIECGDAREVHHFALLLGYGAGTINPYLAFETLDDMIGQGMIREGIDHAKAVNLYRKAIKKGVVKVMSKMGISTIQSYRGAQIFEAIGLNKDFIDRYFDKTASPDRRDRPGGDRPRDPVSPPPGLRRPRGRPRRARLGRLVPVAPRGGIPPLQPRDRLPAPARHPKTGRFDIFRSTPGWSTSRTSGSAPSAGCSSSSSTAGPRCRSRRSSRSSRSSTRFATGAMSYGSISGEAHETLAIAMNRIGGRSNTGEGGEDPARNVLRRQRRRPAEQGQAGRLGPVRRDQRIPRQRRRDPDQGRPGGQARRGGAAPRPEGLALDRQGPVLHPRRLPDQPAAAPRHLLDRGPRPADPRPQERQPPGPDQRQAGGRGRRRHRRRRRLQGPRRRDHDLRPRRRHRRQRP